MCCNLLHTRLNMSLSSCIAFVLALALFFGLGALQQPIPSTYDGYKAGSPSAQVTLESFMDFLCPDSKQSWPVLQQVLSYYGGNKIQHIMHVFALPYHHNAFLAAKAGVILERKQTGLIWKWLDVIFSHQAAFWNAATANMTATQVISAMADLAAPLGISKRDFINGMNDANLDIIARVSWKFSAGRGISGTPSFIVNGVFVPQASSTWSFADWRNLLDPLFHRQETDSK
jgi:hypothetical protein